MTRFASWSDIVDEGWPEDIVTVKKRADTQRFFENYSSSKNNFAQQSLSQRSLSDVLHVRSSFTVQLPKTAKTAEDGLGFERGRYKSDEGMANALPEYLQDIVDTGSVQNFNMYAFSVKNGDTESARNLLRRMIRYTENNQEAAKVLKSAFEINKKFSKYQDALDILHEAIALDPENISFPTEASKLLNDIGWFDEEDKVMLSALRNTNFNSTLLSKMLRSLERRSLLSRARSVLGTIEKDNSEARFEGLLFEVRHGSADNVRDLVNVWDMPRTECRGSVYLEIVEFCARRGLGNKVVSFAKEGLKDVPSLFALCGLALRFHPNENSILQSFEESCDVSQNARSRLAPVCANVMNMNGKRKLGHKIIAQAIAQATPEQKGRIFYNAAILCILGKEMRFVQLFIARGKFFCQKRAQFPFDVLRAKIQETSGFKNAAAEANRVFVDVTNKYPDEWHSHLEYILFLARHKHTNEAIKALDRVLASMPENGRLLALKVQLAPLDKQVETFVETIHQVPKSGEVWLEGARITLNPLSPYFNLKEARFFLNIAHLFTPQYLDIFVEMCRLEMLEKGLYASLAEVQDKFINSEGNQGTVFMRFRILGKEFSKEEFDGMARGVREDISKNSKYYTHAIARSAFVPLSLKEEMERIIQDKEKAVSNFKFGISNFGEKGNLLDIFGTSTAFLT